MNSFGDDIVRLYLQIIGFVLLRFSGFSGETEKSHTTVSVDTHHQFNDTDQNSLVHTFLIFLV